MARGGGGSADRFGISAVGVRADLVRRVVRGIADVFVSGGDATGQQAVLAPRIQVGEQDGDGLPDDPAPVGGGTVTQQGEPGTFQVKQFLGGQVDGDLLGVLLPAAGTALVATVRVDGSRGDWTQKLSNPRQAYPS